MKNFPNGFSSWMETFYEVVSKLNQIEIFDDINNTSSSQIIDDIRESNGSCGMYELAEELTDEFEKLNENREWDGEFFDEIDNFLIDKLINKDNSIETLVNELNKL